MRRILVDDLTHGLLKRLAVARATLDPSVAAYWETRIWDRCIEERRPTCGSWLIEQRLRTINYIQGLSHPVSVLEPGCSTGCMTLDLLRLPNVERVISWDINESALAIAVERAQEHCSRGSAVLFKAKWNEKSMERAIELVGSTSRLVVVAIEVLFHLSDAHDILRMTHMAVPKRTLLIGNLKTASGLLSHSALNRGVVSALARWALANTLHRHDVEYWSVAGHKADQVRDLVTPFALLEMRSNDLYHWFAGTA